jgi:Heavy-metal resistance
MADSMNASDPSPLPPHTGRGVKIALALSLALNLGVAGLAVGAWLKEGRDKGIPREISFGPFSAALDPEDRRALRSQLIERAPDFKAGRLQESAEFGTLLGALRAAPFDPGAMQSAMAAIETRNADRLALGRSLIEARILAMSDADRLAFADRLEAGLRRGKN